MVRADGLQTDEIYNEGSASVCVIVCVCVCVCVYLKICRKYKRCVLNPVMTRELCVKSISTNVQ